INAWIKNYIFNSNISLCELAEVIDKRQISEDKKHQLILWKAAIPCISTQISIPSFMFTSIDKKLEEYLPPAILDLQRNEIRQCVFYSALQVNQEVISEFEEYQLPTNQHLEDIPDARQITASCMISDVNKNQIMSMWTVAVENKLDASKEPFLVASKFESDTPPIIPQHNVPFLTVIHQISQNSITLHERLTDIQLYGKITGLTHKATIKALKKKDMRIISILEDYLKDEEQNENVGGDSELDDDNELDGEKLDDELDDEFDDNKENHENHSFILNNPNKQTKSKGCPKGTKRIKASHEKNSSS
ncbi:20771_t:CDS:2, partial [Rhizophagus irregularis]